METTTNKDLSYVGLLDYLTVNSIYAPELARVINVICNSSAGTKWGYLYYAIDVICPDMSEREFGRMLQSISVAAASVSDRAIRQGITKVSKILKGDRDTEEYKHCHRKIVQLRKSFRQICNMDSGKKE